METIKNIKIVSESASFDTLTSYKIMAPSNWKLGWTSVHIYTIYTELPHNFSYSYFCRSLDTKIHKVVSGLSKDKPENHYLKHSFQKQNV